MKTLCAQQEAYTTPQAGGPSQPVIFFWVAPR